MAEPTTIDSLLVRVAADLEALEREQAPAPRGPQGAPDALLRAASDTGRMALVADDPALRAQLLALALRDLATARAGLLAELTALLGDAAFDGRGGGRARGLARLAPLDRAAADHYVRIAAAHGRVATLVRQLASAHAEALRLLGPESGRAAEEQLRALAADCAALGRIVRGRAAFLPDSLDPALDRLAELQRAITAALGGVAVDTLHTDAADRQARELLRARVAQARRLEAAGAAIRTALPFLRVLALAGGAAATYLVARRRLAQLRRQVEEITPAALLARGLALRRPRADGRGLRTEGRETRAPLHRLRALAAPLARATRDAERAWRKVKSA